MEKTHVDPVSSCMARVKMWSRPDLFQLVVEALHFQAGTHWRESKAPTDNNGREHFCVKLGPALYGDVVVVIDRDRCVLCCAR